ncbi:MarR family winged helix-turn-helix transcriptional regulator [Secundilactobacillus oryzae]|uniref:MarR family winged helix-turn-helix transcriptional regulator n=1 Tax=Secundilactobacillus oryzae TaxID=1202668 RepID=UPI0006D21593|nr:MarR family transcriptional regulator [Secundilactobacillus oryzae]
MANILRSIGVIARALDSIANIEFKQYDLTRGQYLYLVRICENPGIIQERLAEMIRVDRTTAARAIQRLAENDFIERRFDEQNHKTKHLYPTVKGTETNEIIKRENVYSTEVALKGFDADERQTAEALLDRIATNIDADWNAVKKKAKKRNY